MVNTETVLTGNPIHVSQRAHGSCEIRPILWAHQHKQSASCSDKASAGGHLRLHHQTPRQPDATWITSRGPSGSSRPLPARNGFTLASQHGGLRISQAYSNTRARFPRSHRFEEDEDGYLSNGAGAASPGPACQLDTAAMVIIWRHWLGRAAPLS